MLAQEDLVGALTALGEVLQARGLEYSLAAVGGGALLLLDLIDRPTNDLDLVASLDGDEISSVDPMPPALAEAVADVARVLDLPADWMNAGPASLLQLGLPDGFRQRARAVRYGALELLLADRVDQIHFKLYASVDQGPLSKHYADLKALSPTPQELDRAAAWARTHDTSEQFASDLKAAIRGLDSGPQSESL